MHRNSVYKELNLDKFKAGAAPRKEETRDYDKEPLVLRDYSGFALILHHLFILIFWITTSGFCISYLDDFESGILDFDDDGDDSPNDTFPDTTPASTKTSPIVIDLNGDGIKTISRKNSKTYFDLDNNKFAENTSWIDKNDGILINKTLIANSITNGSELFGNYTLLRDGGLANNGFEALKEFVNLNLLIV